MVNMITVTVVLDFMCPWSFIGLKSLDLAIRSTLSRNPATSFATEFMPFEFDPPGTYPQEGLDWTEYCRGYGPEKSRFLLEQKLPRAFELGAALGIDFKISRKLVGTEAVNTALVAAQAANASAGLPFALQMLSLHFEGLRDPNDTQLLSTALMAAGVPDGDILTALTPSAQRTAANAAMTERGRRLCGGSVPKFIVTCSKAPAVDQCTAPGTAAGGGPTSPLYFEQIFARCLQ